jgi:spermidine synthase
MKRDVSAMAALTAGVMGFCGLIFLIAWDGILKYHFGADAVSATIIAIASLLGLVAGAYIAGRSNNCDVKTLALFELACGLFGILSPYLIAAIAPLIAGALKAAPEQMEGVRAAVVVGSLLLSMPPAALIGGGWALLFRSFPGSRDRMIQAVLALGACIGMSVEPFLLLHRFDLPAVLMIAGGINVVLALALLLFSRKSADMKAADAPVPERKQAALLWSLAFIAGFIAIVLGVSLLRAMPIANPSSAYNFPLTLTFFLLAFALGSLLFACSAEAVRTAILYRAGLFLAGAGMAMFLGIWIASYLQANYYPVSFLPLLDGNYAGLFWCALFSVVLIMPAPLLLGAVLSWLQKLHAAARLLPAFFLGGCCGLLLANFAGFPLLGTRGLLSFVYVLACGSGIALMAWTWRRDTQRGGSEFSGTLAGGILVLAAMVAVIMPSGMWLTYITGGPEPNWEVREGISGIAQLWWVEDHADLRVNGEYVSRLPYDARHLNQEVFLLAQPRRERVLVLGLGSPEIIRSLAEDPGVLKVDVVDPSHELQGLLAGGKAAEMLNQALSSPKVRIFTADARVAVSLYEAAAFDVVFDNLGYPSWAGSTGVKSENYFREIRRVLKAEGVYLAGANYSGANRRAVLAGLLNTFEIVKEHHQAPIVMAMSVEPQYSDQQIIQLAQPRAEIFGLHYMDVRVLPGWFRDQFFTVTREQLEGVTPIRDGLPVYEYLSPAAEK